MSKLTIGDRLYIARKRLGLSQDKLGQIAGLSDVEILKIERNINNPKLRTLQKLAKGLKLKTWELVRYLETGH